MTMSPGSLRLAADFPPAGPADWQRLVLEALRTARVADGATTVDTVEALLATTTYDGIRVAPLHTRPQTPAVTGVPGSAPFTRGGRAVRAAGHGGTPDGPTPDGPVAGWDVRQRHADPDPTVSRAAILADLANGVTSVWLTLGPGHLAPDTLPEVLDGVRLDLAGVVLDPGGQVRAAADAYLALAADRRTDPGALTGGLGADPLGWQARTGQPPDLSALTTLAARCAAEHPGLRAVTIDATVYHDAGGSDAEELGCALATGVAYLRAMTGTGLDLRTALNGLEFRHAASADQFLTIAKLRAARRAWARVAQVCGAPQAGAQRQHAVTSTPMMTARDPWVNMLRTTLACFAAGVGGADAVTVQPFDARLGLPDGFARRIARNTQSVLLEEAHLGRVLDPAGGSWYVEALTADLARAAWEWFTEIERAGGMATALDCGLVADRLATTWTRRSENLAHRRDPITGVSEFPNLDERLPSRTRAAPPPGGGLPRRHYGERFESLRDRADAHLVATGTRPSVFLATLGPLAAHGARAEFAANLFAAGGITTTRSGPAGEPAPGPAGVAGVIAAAFAADPTTVACVCGTDRAYAEQAAAVATALRATGARRVWLAGRPGDHDGVDGYLQHGCDAVAVIETTLRDLETGPARPAAGDPGAAPR